jgi:hypothetical protein
MSVIRISTVANSGYLEKIVSMTGSGGKFTLYTSPMPSTGGGAVGAATQLGQVTLASTLGTVTWNSGTNKYDLTFNASTPDMVTDADGTAAWARITSSGGTWIADFDVTATGGGGAIIMPNTTIYSGGTLTLSSAVLSLPLP